MSSPGTRTRRSPRRELRRRTVPTRRTSGATMGLATQVGAEPAAVPHLVIIGCGQLDNCCSGRTQVAHSSTWVGDIDTDLLPAVQCRHGHIGDAVSLGNPYGPPAVTHGSAHLFTCGCRDRDAADLRAGLPQGRGQLAW